ncbi:hypothetical protein GGI07_004250 [Coemansia sp. Benny D115]|nr:hypothetical protein GGI07_004250 [Coemansia sp. Benny D115]
MHNSPVLVPRRTNGASSASNSPHVSENDILRRTTRVLRQLYHREQQWLASRTPEQTASLTQQGQLPLAEQLHYGELAFVLLRLKPCTIIDYATGDDSARDQVDDYVQAVIQPTLQELNALGDLATGLLQGTAGDEECNAAVYPRAFRLVCARIQGPLSSPEVPNWAGAYVVYDEMWEESSRWVHTHLLDPSRTSVTEDELARGLDYPGSIPKTTEDMQLIVPVSYLGRIK